MFKRLEKVVMVLLAAMTVGSAVATSTMTRANASTRTATFINKMKTPIRTTADKYDLYGSVMMAQAALESAWGQSGLSKESTELLWREGCLQG